VVTTHKPGPGILQRVESSRRSYREGPSQRTLESIVKLDLQTPGWKGNYSLHKKHVYSGTRIVTFYRKMEAQLSGPTDFSMSEQTQMARNPKGDFKGTFLREYVAGKDSQAPAARLMAHFDPYLLVKRFKATISARKDGTWQEVARAHGESFQEGIGNLKEKVASIPGGQKDPLSELLMALWSAAVAHNSSMEMTQFLYPLLNPTGEQYFQDVNMDPVAERSQAALAAMGNRREDLGRYQELSKSLKRLRSVLGKALQKNLSLPGSASQPGRIAQSYLEAAKPLASPPRQETPSPFQGLQSTTGWLAMAFEQLKSFAPGSQDYQGHLNFLPEQWVQVLAEQRSEVFLRALYLLLIRKEIRELEPLIAAADKALGPQSFGASLRQVQQDLGETAKSWQTPLALRETPAERSFLTLWRLPLGLFVEKAWAAEEALEKAPEEKFLSQSGPLFDPTGVPLEVSHPVSAEEYWKRFLEIPIPDPVTACQ